MRKKAANPPELRMVRAIRNAVVIGIGRHNKKRTLRELETRQNILRDYNVHY
ncbi:hypothetical protein CE91St47_33910 [Eubacteriales bacterium]|nr:hypothetical protein CE91St47_33910 [Eubacteriales bacterium]